MNNTIIMPKTIKTLVPKPTKKQIVEALIHKAKARHDLEEKKKLIKSEKIDEKIKNIAVKAFLKNQEIAKVSVDYRNNINLFIDKDYLGLGNLIKEKKENSVSYFYENDVKKEILKSLENPNPLIGNKETDKYLEGLLDSIMGKKSEVLVCDVEVCVN
jgi:hypothetical protein